MASASNQVACYNPIRAYRAPGGGVTFSPKGAYVDLPELMLPCGQCIGCRLERSRQWAVRCVHEASLHTASCFVTLTYDKVPPGGSLDRRAFPGVIKALRRRHPGLSIKYFHCGEYGELLERPHYHGLIFGYGFPDKTLWRRSAEGNPQWRSRELEKLWPHGFSMLAALTFETAAYTARYCTKKINGEKADDHYRGREPEFMTCSKGIGEAWLARYAGDTYRDDTIISRGRPAKPPRYYDKKLKSLDPELWRKIELRRIISGNTVSARWNRTPERLAVREEVKTAQLNITKRAYECS